MKEISFDQPEGTIVSGDLSAQKRSIGSKKAPTIRTYSGDVASMVKDSGITKTQVIMAEEERRESRGESRTVHEDDSHLTYIIVILLLVLFSAIAVGAYVLIGTTPIHTETEEDTDLPKIARMYDVNIGDTAREQIIADTATAYSKTSFSPNESRTVVFTKPNKNGIVHDATIHELLDALAITPIPDRLSRAIDGKATLHVYGRTILDPLIGALNFNVLSYPNAFAGMLDWERFMARDITLILYPKFPRDTLLSLADKEFTDARVMGHDVRILQNDDGDTILTYAFLDKEHLVITGNEAILGLIIDENSSSTPNTIQ